MTQNFDRAESRLNNIRAIEPLLGALRTLSMGAWQLALNKIARMQEFEENYDHILMEILPKIKNKRLPNHGKKQNWETSTDTVILIVGTERGLCGKFNQALAQKTLEWIETHQFPSHQVWVLGFRMVREIELLGIKISWRKSLPTSQLATYHQAYLTTQNWLEQYETFDFNNLFILYNQAIKGGGYQFSASKLLPFEIQHSQAKLIDSKKHWPPPIIETTPEGIYHQIIEHFIASKFYQILLESAAAEHSSRYSLMQDAEDNAEEIIRELHQVINNERKRKITQEMQELATGSGLLDN